MKLGRTNSIIICAEGAGDARSLGEWLKEHTKIDVCTTTLGFIQRGGQPTARDCQLGSVLGACAVTALLRGETGALIGMHRGRVRILPYEEAKKRKNHSAEISTISPSCSARREWNEAKRRTASRAAFWWLVIGS